MPKIGIGKITFDYTLGEWCCPDCEYSHYKKDLVKVHMQYAHPKPLKGGGKND